MLKTLKAELSEFPENANLGIYPESISATEFGTVFVARKSGTKEVFALVKKHKVIDFTDPVYVCSGHESGNKLFSIPCSWKNARILHNILPHTAPSSLKDKNMTFGTGDRLGITTPAHAAAFTAHSEVNPVFAQQSVRELNLSGRNFKDVLSCATFGVLESGFRREWGADGDHLKNRDAVKAAAEAGMTMFTLDLSEFLAHPRESYHLFSDSVRDVIDKNYIDREFRLENRTLKLTRKDAIECACLYWDALDYCGEISSFLHKHVLSDFDLEISIDETVVDTRPEHHLFFVLELKRRGIGFSSIAPKFVGEFQKGIDYIGNLDNFLKHIRIHQEIRKSLGGYKLSIHSGSDKFSVFPVISEVTGKNFHLKTSGTTWLEGVRVIAKRDYGLYRSIHSIGMDFFSQGKQHYHITAELENIPELGTCPDGRLEDYLSLNDSRQMIHIATGEIMKNKAVIEKIYTVINKHEQLYADCIKNHFERHFTALGI